MGFRKSIERTNHIRLQNMTTFIESKHFQDQRFSEVDFSTLSLQEILRTAKYKELLEELKTIDKIELHAHLGGAVSLDFLRLHSSPQDYNELSGFIDKLKAGVDYQEAFKAFPMISKILNSNQLIEEAAFDFCQSQFNDNVTFSELRTGLKRLDGGFEDCLQAVLNGLEKGRKTFNIHVDLVLSLRRDTSAQDANETIGLAIKYRDRGITGIDVSGESTKGDGTGIFEALEKARSYGFPITLHLGENCQETPEQQMRELANMQPSRVGHAVFLCPEALQWIKEKGIVVEACIRSALSVDMIKQPGEHPALKLFREGHPVVFCTDDSTLFGNLSEELALVAALCDFSKEKVTKMQKEACQHAFTKRTLSPTA